MANESAWWSPANLISRSPLIQSIAKLVGYGPARPDQTTETGAAGTASPSTFQFDLLTVQYARQAVIADVRKLMLDDGRAAKSNSKFAREATRGGLTIECKPAGTGTKRQAKAAQVILDQLMKDAKINTKLLGWAKMVTQEGDLFLQNVVLDDRIVDIKRMPAAGMERNTDEQDHFPDLSQAFLQRDLTTQIPVAYFAHWQITHIRWGHIDGERYGVSEYIQARRPGRMLDILEQCQVIRRITRAAQRRVHSVGNKENPGTLTHIEDYKAQNGLGANVAATFDPMNQTMDYFGNGMTSVTTLDGDGTVHEIDDIRYAQDGFTVALGTPKALYGLDAEAINRDIMDGQEGEWLKEVQELSGVLGAGLVESFDLALALAGINPDAVDIIAHWTESNLETATDRAARIVVLRQATVGTGKNAIASPLISQQRAIAMLAEDTGADDADAEIDDIEAEMERLHLREDPAEQEAAEAAQALALAKAAPPGQADPTKAGKPIAQGQPAQPKAGQVQTDSAITVAVAAVQDSRGRILVARRSVNCLHGGEWETPGGHIEPGETPADAAVREVLEETGLHILITTVPPVPFALRGGGRGLMFLALWIGGSETLTLDEHDLAEWVAPEDLGRLTPVPPRFAANVRRLLRGVPTGPMAIPASLPAPVTTLQLYPEVTHA